MCRGAEWHAKAFHQLVFNPLSGCNHLASWLTARRGSNMHFCEEAVLESVLFHNRSWTIRSRTNSQELFWRHHQPSLASIPRPCYSWGSFREWARSFRPRCMPWSCRWASKTSDPANLSCAFLTTYRCFNRSRYPGYHRHHTKVGMYYLIDGVSAELQAT